ncbi:MAG: glycosyltransferase [Clostridia bacterium]|nr:glycosyltransferase [Clostridia bacterium]
MKILHIASITDDPCSGTDVAVPQHVLAQQALAEVAFINVTNVAIPGVVTQLPYSGKAGLDGLAGMWALPDVVVFHGVYVVEYLALYPWFVEHGVPYIIVPHGCFSRVAQRKKRLKKLVANALLFNRFFRGATAVQYLSAGEQAASAYTLPGFIGTNGICMPSVYKTSFSENGLRLVFIGRCEVAIKGLDLLLQAVAQERALFAEKGVHLALYGPDVENGHAQLRDWIREWDLEDCVTLHGPITGKEKEAALLGADWYIQTSRTEGMPMSIIEALSYGVPCFVTEGTGLADTIAQAGAGLGCATTAEGIGRGLRKLVASSGQLPVFSKGARELAKKGFERQAVAAETVAAYAAYAQKSTKGL